MKKVDRKRAVLAALLRDSHTGRGNAICSMELAKALHISKSELQRKVNLLRQREEPICSGPGTGYFYASSAEDVLDTIYFLEQLIRSLQATVKGMRGSLKKFKFNDSGGGGYR